MSGGWLSLDFFGTKWLKFIYSLLDGMNSQNCWNFSLYTRGRNVLESAVTLPERKRNDKQHVQKPQKRQWNLHTVVREVGFELVMRNDDIGISRRGKSEARSLYQREKNGIGMVHVVGIWKTPPSRLKIWDLLLSVVSWSKCSELFLERILPLDLWGDSE